MTDFILCFQYLCMINELSSEDDYRFRRRNLVNKGHSLTIDIGFVEDRILIDCKNYEKI